MSLVGDHLNLLSKIRKAQFALDWEEAIRLYKIMPPSEERESNIKALNLLIESRDRGNKYRELLETLSERLPELDESVREYFAYKLVYGG